MYLTTLADVDADILANDVAVLATNGPDGRPQLTAVWYLVDGERIRISVARSSQKVANLQRDARCSLIVFDPHSGNHYLEVRGDAAVSEDVEYGFAEVIGARYGCNMRGLDAPGDVRMVIDVTPSRIFVNDGR